MKRILALATLLLTLASTLPGWAQEVEMFSLVQDVYLPGYGHDELKKNAEAFFLGYGKYRRTVMPVPPYGTLGYVWETNGEVTGVQYRRKVYDIDYRYSLDIKCRKNGYTVTLENLRVDVVGAAIFNSEVPVFYGGLPDFNKRRIFFCDTVKEAVTRLFEDEIMPHVKEYMEYGKSPEIQWRRY